MRLILISTVALALAACADDTSSNLPPVRPDDPAQSFVYASEGPCGSLPSGAIARVVSRDDVAGTVTVRSIVDDEGPQMRFTIPQSCVDPADPE